MIWLARGEARAATTASLVVTFSVTAVNSISLSGNPGPLSVVLPLAGHGEARASDSSMRYSLTTDRRGEKITGRLDAAMPTGTFLKLELQAPPGATSQGEVSLGTTDSCLLTGITTAYDPGRPLTISLVATPQARVAPWTTRTLYLTITNGH